MRVILFMALTAGNLFGHYLPITPVYSNYHYQPVYVPKQADAQKDNKTETQKINSALAYFTLVSLPYGLFYFYPNLVIRILPRLTLLTGVLSATTLLWRLANGLC